MLALYSSRETRDSSDIQLDSLGLVSEGSLSSLMFSNTQQ